MTTINYKIRLLKALDELEKMQTQYPKNLSLKHCLIKTYISLENYTKALDFLHDLSRNSDNDVITNKYLRQKGDVRFYNFWPTKDVSDYWFYKFLRHYNLFHYPINFYSVFGPKGFVQKPSESLKVFYTGENPFIEWFPPPRIYRDHCIRYVDLSLGFEYLNEPNYLRFPIWILYLITANITYYELKQLINQLNNPLHRTQKRVKFASLVANHDESVDIKRQDIYNLMSLIDYIECPSKLLHNTDDLATQYQDNKIEYLKQFKFNICPENSRRSGYITRANAHF